MRSPIVEFPHAFEHEISTIPFGQHFKDIPQTIEALGSFDGDIRDENGDNNALVL